MEKIKDFEEREFAGTKREVEFNPMTLTKLEPLNEGGAGGLLQKVGPRCHLLPRKLLHV